MYHCETEKGTLWLVAICWWHHSHCENGTMQMDTGLCFSTKDTLHAPHIKIHNILAVFIHDYSAFDTTNVVVTLALLLIICSSNISLSSFRKKLAPQLCCLLWLFNILRTFNLGNKLSRYTMHTRMKEWTVPDTVSP